MTRGLLLARDGFVESHLEYAYHRLREDAVLVDVTAPGGGAVRGDQGTSWATVRIDELPAGQRYDLGVIPGGERPERYPDEATRRWLVEHVDGGGIVCAVGDGVGVLLTTGLLAGRLVTGPDRVHPEFEAADATPTGEAVTVDGLIVTVRDTEALPFGIAATLGNVAIPQGPAAQAHERPSW